MQQKTNARTILSPILFNLYINNLAKNLQKDQRWHGLFADDIAIETNLDNIDSDISILKNWATNNQIEINWSKSGIMINKKTKAIKTRKQIQASLSKNHPEIPIYSQ